MADPDITSFNVADFIGGLTLDEIPRPALRRLRAAVLDLAAVALAGRPAPAAKIAADTASALFCGAQATAWLDERPLSAAGAAFANGVLANVLDLDDGHSFTKGHPGAAVIPAAVAVAEYVGATPEETLTAIAVGYEIAIRAGISQHAALPLYHGTGSWGALGAAAAAASLLKLPGPQTGHALGLAEYHAPMSLIMRSVAQPAMTKDGIGWGAHTGVTAAFLAKAGFTATVSAFAADTAAWADLGRRWHVEDLYLKLYPCCRWAQPAVAAAARLREAPAYLPAQVKTVTITTFEAAAALAAGRPADTEQAQYSLRWPVASMLASGRFGVDEALGPYDDKQTLEIFDRIRVEVSPAYTGEFPARRLASVTVGLGTGETLHSGVAQAPGEAADADWLAQATAKARTLLGSAPPWPATLRHLGVAVHQADL